MTENNKDTTFKFVNKMYRYMKNGSDIETFMQKFHMSYPELEGLLELCKMYGKNIDIAEKKGGMYFEKPMFRNITTLKPDLDYKNLIHTEFLAVSDTHLGSIKQQLHLLNELYEEAYKRDIHLAIHCGDMVDGNYPNRPENPRQQFLHGFDEQAGYVVDMYPKVAGIKTKYILGSHDETHYKNGQATINEWVSRCRRDMEYLGQDSASIEINGVKIFLDHPGGGSAQSISYKPQKRIESLESEYKPKLLLIGHYHKSYLFLYRNVVGIEVPALCDKTQFQKKQGLSNIVGGYFIDMYSDKKGNIQYIDAEEVIFPQKDMWDEAGKDKKKVKQLVIK